MAKLGLIRNIKTVINMTVENFIIIIEFKKFCLFKISIHIFFRLK